MNAADSTSHEDRLRQTLLSQLKSFSLTYEQHQLLHRNQLEIVADYIIRTRRLFTWLLALLSAVLASQGLLAMFAGQATAIWGFPAGLVGVWAFRRHRATAGLAAAQAAYERSRRLADIAPPTLGDELMLYCTLDWDEHKAIRTSSYLEAAHRLISRRLTNTVVLVGGSLAVSWVALWRTGGAAWPLAVVLCGGAVIGVLGDVAVIRRVRAIIARHQGPQDRGPQAEATPYQDA